ncbi:MAG: hydroxychlorobactene glucosyltransferase CruC [Chloroflexota bacterium]
MKPGAILAIQCAAGWLSWRNFRALGRLGTHPPLETMPSVSIVVPARNEESTLPALLTSLRELHYPVQDVLVVNDQSTDRTSIVVGQFGVRELQGSAPPPGWTGKCWACQQGANATHSEWILFTDADTVHTPDSVERALSEAQAQHLDLLSLLPRQQCESFWERLLVPYAHTLFFVGAVRGNNRGGAVTANGQYLLFKRRVYEDLGGHESVRGSVIEDVEIGRRLASRGGRLALMRAEDAVRVRMYRDFGALWEGFTKNAVRFVSFSPRAGALTILATIAFAASIPSMVRTSSVAMRVALYVAPVGALLPWLRNARVPVVYALLHPLATAVFQGLALDSMRRTVIRGRTVWKGRRY